MPPAACTAKVCVLQQSFLVEQRRNGDNLMFAGGVTMGAAGGLGLIALIIHFAGSEGKLSDSEEAFNRGDWQEGQDFRDASETLFDTAVGMYIIAGAAALAGLITLSVGAGRNGRATMIENRVQPSVSLRPGGGGQFTLLGSF